MQFWYRFVVLITLCVVLPQGLLVYQHTHSEIERSKVGGELWAKSAGESMRRILSLRSHEVVTAASNLAQQINEKDIATNRRALLPLINAVATKQGFLWVVDEAGELVAEANNRSAPARAVTGLPAFSATQAGFSSGRLYREGTTVFMTGSVPLVLAGRAHGAVIVGRQLDSSYLSGLVQGDRNAEVTLVVQGKVVATSLSDGALAEVLAESVDGSSTPQTSGWLSRPLVSGVMPFTPILVPRDLRGSAYTSVALGADGDPDVRWILSTPSGASIGDLAQRQELMFVLCVASILIAMLFGIWTNATFVKPIRTISEHLSGIQMKTGAERELPEFQVSPPFRRLTRLLNMMANKWPHAVSPTSAPALSAFEQSLPSPSHSHSQPSLDLSPSGRPSQPLDFNMLGSNGQPGLRQPSRPPAPGPGLGFAGAGVPAASPLGGKTPAPEAPSPQVVRGAEVPGARVSSAPASARVGGSAMLDSAGGSVGGSAALGATGLLGGAAPQAAAPAPIGDSTVVAQVNDDLIAQSREDAADEYRLENEVGGDSTVVASVPQELLERSSGQEPAAVIEDPEMVHFRETYTAFIELRKACGEAAVNLPFERFLKKLEKNRDSLKAKYSCKTVRFQVYQKDGKAALKATPIR